ncbi:MAG: hypothetical protein J0L64_04980 [Acidobacteria bacterium]|nr:hypothetical protein [Acidobacteriota bacterium]
MTNSVRPPASSLACLEPKGALEHFFADEAEGYWKLIQSFPPGTSASEVRMMGGLLRSALRELRCLQQERLREEAALGELAA